MLRDFEYHPRKNTISEILGRFDSAFSGDNALVRFEVITPDSFMWRLLINDGVYYLYAEDYVPSLDHATAIFNQYIENDGWILIKPKTVIQF